MVTPEHQTWHGNIVWPFSCLVLWRANNPCWVGTPCWLLPGRLSHAWQASALCCARPARLLHTCDLRLPRHPAQKADLAVSGGLAVSAGSASCAGSAFSAGLSARGVMSADGTDSVDFSRHMHNTYLTTAGWSRLMCSRNPAGGCRRRYRMIHWTTSTLFTRLLSHWIVASRSCRPGRWIPFPASVTRTSWGWWWTSMVTLAMEWASPFRRVSRRTTVAGKTVPAPILIPILRQPWFTDSARLHSWPPSLNRHCWQRLWLSPRLRKCERLGNFGTDSKEDERWSHEAAILQHWLNCSTKAGINLLFYQKWQWKSPITWDRLTRVLQPSCDFSAKRNIVPGMANVYI